MPDPKPDWIAEALKIEQDVLVKKLNLAKQSISHPSVKGGVAEDIWLEFFRRYLPGRYQVSSGFVVDSSGGISHQIDIIIYDGHFTPALLSQENHRYIPAEAVYMAFEVKPDFSSEYLLYARDKLASIKSLSRTSTETRANGKKIKAWKHFEIFGGLLALEGTANNFKRQVKRHVETREDPVNCGCCLRQGAFDNFDKNSISFSPSPETSLPYFMIRLLVHLNNIGTVPPVHWGKYLERLKSNTTPEPKAIFL